LTLSDVASYQNLSAAFIEARRRKSNITSVREFWADYEEYLLTIQEQLLHGQWHPAPYRHFIVNDTKPRLISAVPFSDRIVHHAIVRQLEPFYEHRFCNRSYACRVGFGTHRAVQRLQRDMQSADYVLKCDIRKYFPSINHRLLTTQLDRYITCTQLRDLIALIIASYKTNQLTDPCGLPLGNQTSQFFGNVYLNDFDHLVTKDMGCQRYIRYVDDFVLLSDSKDQLHKWREEITEYLRVSLQLELHPSKVFVQPVTVGLDFLGYTVFPSHRHLRPSNGYRFRRRMRKWLRTLPASDEAVRCRIAAWVGHAKHADTYGLRRTVFTELGFIHHQ
jgi:retron-type reverse transcriptase